VTQITLPARKAWEYLLRHMKRMPSSSPSDQLTALRTSLEHFEQSPDFGDSDCVAAIRIHLQLRIRQAEGALRCPPWVSGARHEDVGLGSRNGRWGALNLDLNQNP